MEFEGFIDGGDWVMVPWSAQVRGRESGISIRDQRDLRSPGARGQDRVEEYRTKEQALEAVGLSE